MSSPNGTQAIDRAAMLLTQVVHGSEPVSFTELTAACGLAKSTTSRLLMALERHQLVRRDGEGRFWPGELFVRYAWRGTAGADLIAVAQPFLARLGEQTAETINLGIAARAGGGGAGSDASSGGSSPDEMVVQQIAQVDSRYMIGGTNWVGLAVPLHCSALGKVLLAFGAADDAVRAVQGAHAADHHEPRGPGRRARHGPPARLRGDRRGTRAWPGRGGCPGLRRRGVGHRRHLGLRSRGHGSPPT